MINVLAIVMCTGKTFHDEGQFFSIELFLTSVLLLRSFIVSWSDTSAVFGALQRREQTPSNRH